MSQKIPKNFRDLFDMEDFHGVEIPIIQRDYAQGRITETEIRNQFIYSLYEALVLPTDSPRLPLDLDFVYGSMDKSAHGTVFSPLDGQQRLTALFLLHWYLAVHDEKLADFKRFMSGGNHQSRFSYVLRASAEEFFGALANADFELTSLGDEEDGDGGVMSRAITDQPWFFLAWKQHPTVASALRVLDTIHDRFKDTEDLFERLVDRENPAITFQFLNLHDFGLSDELYIKMNARGKALTEFEAFKAQLVKKIDGLLQGKRYPIQNPRMSPKEYFSQRVDSVWGDLFWKYHDNESRTFDQQFMNFIHGLVKVTFPYAKRDKDVAHVNTTMRTLSDKQERYNFYRYETEGCLTADFANMLISVLDQISSNGDKPKLFLPETDYYDEHNMFKRILQVEPRRLLQVEWIQFYGHCAYLHRFSPNPGDKRFGEWIRLVSNLALNTIINRTRDFIRALVGVRTLLEEIGTSSLIDYVANRKEAAPGLNQQQWREEHLKAQLMRSNPEWRDLLLLAEKHRYFRGQIEFLLDFSGVLERWSRSGGCDWTDEEDEDYHAAFLLQYERADAIFGDTGLRKFDAFVWERSLLSFGDYLLPKGRNLSLLDDEDRDASWKRLLRGSDKVDDRLLVKRNLVRYALAVVDPSHVQNSLQSRIEEYLAAPDPAEDAWWRHMLIECPEALAYCRQRFLRDAGQDGLFLLKQQRISAPYAELHTYYLARFVFPGMRERGELKAFKLIKDNPVSYEERLPSALLLSEKSELEVDIRFQSDQFQICVNLSEDSPDGLLGRICHQQSYSRLSDQTLTAEKWVPEAEILSVIEKLSDCIYTYIAENTT